MNHPSYHGITISVFQTQRSVGRVPQAEFGDANLLCKIGLYKAGDWSSNGVLEYCYAKLFLRFIDWELIIITVLASTTVDLYTYYIFYIIFS